jgi:hypothetical protein
LWAEFALKSLGFGGFGKTSGEVICVKSFVSITYKTLAVLVKNIRQKECVKADRTLPVDGRFYGARQNQQCEEKLPEETTTALKSGRTLTHKIVSTEGINIFKSPIFLDIL